MSIRVIVLTIYVVFFSIHAWRKSWYQSTCAFIILLAVAFHEDVPPSMFGVPGLSLINILLLNIMGAWWKQHRSQGMLWDAPKKVNLKLFFFFTVSLVSTFRLLTNMDAYYVGSMSENDKLPGLSDFIIEYIFDMIRYSLPAFFIYVGCRTRKDVYLGLFSILGMYLLIGAQVVNYMPLSALTMSGPELSYISFKILKGTLGYSRVTASMVLSGASWAVLCTLPLTKNWYQKVGIFVAFGVIAFGQALTGGRMGYLTFGIIGAIIGIFKWRKMLLMLFVVGIAVPVFVPAARDRLMMIFQSNSETAGEDASSGRTEVWPHVIDKIKQKPWFGYGRESMITSGLHKWVSTYVFGYKDFTHPHQAYLQFLFDNGIIGFLLAFQIFILIVKGSFWLMQDKADLLFGSVGGASFSLIIALLVASFTGQTFYIMHQSVGMWALAGLMIRVTKDRDILTDMVQTAPDLHS